MKVNFDSSLIMFNNLVGTYGDEQVREWIERGLTALEKLAGVEK